MNFLPLRFYVKSILGILEVLNHLLQPTWRLLILIFVNLFALFEGRNYPNEKFRTFKMAKKSDFRTSRFSTLDFTYNLRDKKILRFLHCAAFV